MPDIKYDEKLLFAKKQDTNGSGYNDAHLDAANAVKVINLEPSIYDGERKSLEYVKGHLGSNPEINVNMHNTFKFATYMQGSGNRALAPAFAALLLAAGFNQVESGAVGAEIISYTLVSKNYTQISLAMLERQENGKDLLTTNANAMGNASFTGNAQDFPKLEFDNFVGKFETPTEIDKVTPDFSAYLDPNPITKGNTPVVKLLHTGDSLDIDLVLESYVINLNREVVYSTRPNQEGGMVGDRNIEGVLVFEAKNLADFDIYKYIESHEGIKTLEFKLTHGKESGKRAHFHLPKIQLLQPSPQEINKIKYLSVPFKAIPSDAGNDEFTLTFD